jgi:hypothetical protein
MLFVQIYAQPKELGNTPHGFVFGMSISNRVAKIKGPMYMSLVGHDVIAVLINYFYSWR